MQIVQFVGKCIKYNEDSEWHVTQAILSNSLAVASHESRSRRNEQVDDIMHRKQLTHVGWLRQASVTCPLSTLDLDTQRVRVVVAVGFCGLCVVYAFTLAHGGYKQCCNAPVLSTPAASEHDGAVWTLVAHMHMRIYAWCSSHMCLNLFRPGTIEQQLVCG